jgi:hypothetical protein
MKTYLKLKTIGILGSLLLLAFSTLTAQSVTDTVSIGAGYSQQSWYKLQSGDAVSAAKAEWDIAFELSAQGSSILFNTVAGASLWAYPNADTSGWATLDTAGIGSWQARWNSDTSWSEGAFSRYLNTGDPFDLGWGVYSSLTHYVTGDSLYVVKLGNGAYKKLWIRKLATGMYTFTHADLNGSNLQDRTITKSTYAGKNFVYYSLQNDAILDREPLGTDWDLFFTQYTAFIPSAYTVSGVLVNKNDEVAKVENVADVNTYTNWAAATFQTEINTIGYGWKAFTGAWVIQDSLLYFLRKPSGEVWKLIFTGFEGGATGNFHFSKELMNPTAIEDQLGTQSQHIDIYPNPSRGQAISLRYDLEKAHRDASVKVLDLNGKTVWQMAVTGIAGENLQQLDLHLPQGLYILDLALDGQHNYRRLVIE